MKKFMLVMLAVASQGAFATSILSNILSVERYDIDSGRVRHELAVYGDGTVVDRAVGTRRRAIVVAKLSGDQVDRLNRLIRRSRPEIMRKELTMAKCIAKATQKTRYSALNGGVALRDGDMCAGGFNVNIRPAAKRLVRVLDLLQAAAHQGTNMSVVESQVADELN